MPWDLLFRYVRFRLQLLRTETEIHLAYLLGLLLWAALIAFFILIALGIFSLGFLVWLYPSQGMSAFALVGVFWLILAVSLFLGKKTFLRWFFARTLGTPARK
ncbi:MAG: hypothetical protein ACUVRD_02920 [Bacteroidia bacterium]